MYYYLVRLCDPALLLLLLTGLGLALLWRKRETTRRRLLLATVPFALYCLLSVPAVSYLALGSLEWGYPPLDGRSEDVEAIVVLSGYMKWGPSGDRPELGEDTLARCLRAIELYRAGRPCRVLVSGGE